MTAGDERLVFSYLLGRLSNQDRSAFETRLIVEEGLMEATEAAGVQLMRDALRGELSPEDRAAFENHFLSFEDWRQRYDQTKSLFESLRKIGKDAGGAGARVLVARGGGWLIAAAVASALGLAALTWQNAGLRSQLRVALARRGAPAPVSIEPVLSFVLEPGLTKRGATKPNRLRIPDSAGLVSLALNFDSPQVYPSYGAVLRVVDGDSEVWGQAALEARHSSGTWTVTVSIPSLVLAPGDYVMELQGVRDGVSRTLETYSFGVVRP